MTPEDLDEIIAIQFGKDIYFGQTAIDKCLELQDFTCIHRRAVFKLMACLDVGEHWEGFAYAPTLFKMSELKEFCARGLSNV